MIINTQIIIKNISLPVKITYDICNMKNCSLVEFISQNEYTIKPKENFPYNPKIHLFYQNDLHSQIIIFLYVECSSNIVNHFTIKLNDSTYDKSYIIK